MKPLYIFDLDGTLADLKHRRHFVERPSLRCYDCGGKNHRNCVQCGDLDVGWKANWDAFHAACVDDTPIEPVLAVLRNLAPFNDIWVWSGRSDAVREQTENWLHMAAGLHGGHYEPQYRQLKMRRASDYTPDDVLKLSWYQAMSVEDRRRLVAVFDDRDRVVAMWRKQGVVCLQCAPGDF